MGSVPPLQVCQGQQFQVWRLMSHLTSSMATHSDDVLLEHYLYSWDELIKYGVCVSVCESVYKGNTF